MVESLSNSGPGRRGTERLRLPPHSLEAERSLLGGLMLDRRAWDMVADAVEAADFYRADHRLIFEAVATLVERDQPPDAVTVSEALARQGALEAAGGLDYIAELVEETVSAANIRAYARIVRERAMLRQLIEIGGDIAASALEEEGRTVDELVDQAEQRVFEIAERGQRKGSGFVPLKQILPQTIDRLDVLSHTEGDVTGVSTGFGEMDKKTAGLQRGDLIIVAGRPSMGKTTLAMNMAENAAIGASVPVAIFSMEMSAEQLSFRMISSIGRVNQQHLRTGRLTEEDWSRIDSAVSIMSGAPIFIDDTPALTPTEVRARARRLKREHGLGLVVVDYLQLMQVSGTVENRATEISEISRSLKALAKELAVPVIALSQLNRSVEQRADKKPVMSDLRECVTGDTLVCLTDGRRVPIRSLVGSAPEVWSIDERQRLTPGRADKVWYVGRKPVFRVELASGRSIRATAEHRMLGASGWTTIGSLAIGDRLAIARRFPELSDTVRWPDHWVILLGHLADAQRRFADVVGGYGPLAEAIVELSRYLESVHINTNVDILPVEVFTGLRAAMRARGVSTRAMARMRGTAYGGSSHFRFAPSRATIAQYADLLRVANPAAWAESDLFWDRVTAVIPDGDEDVFDLTVPGLENWLADGIVTHNSGAIEQDADLIVFIYREEVYEPDTPRKGIADIIIGKQRNGPIGEFHLTFLGEFTKFENLVAESYGEGVY
ncbi:MAG TPA: replicative DNA helicase [Gammaproteobacteria bacterium]|nr:replicative DNA helicase [Gammaproteobacteria bacterium]